MEKAVLKTIIYADIFDYPLKAWEIHKWLIEKSATLQQTESSLNRLLKKGKVRTSKGFFYLKEKESLIRKRKLREKQSIKYFIKAKILTHVLKLIPTIKLIGISGGLALNNASKSDDIDLFLITSNKRIWLSRILVIFILDFIGVRRKAGMKNNQASGKFCVNILLEENKLMQTNKDLYVAHEILQMKVLWQKDSAYKKYLEDNEWAFKFLPNWITGQNVQGKMYNVKNNSKFYIVNYTFNLLEDLAWKFQLKIMQKPQGMERIEEGALYFHPNDVREHVLKEFAVRVKKFSSS